MKIHFHTDAKNSGSVLVITLILAVILGTTLGGYLVWVRSQTTMVAESQGWNSALTLAEAGIEDGMAQLNISGTNFTANLASGHALSGSLYGPWTNTLSSGGYSVAISNDNPPTVYATGRTKVPYMAVPITRTVKVQTMTQPAFGNGIAALQNVDLKGYNITVDSYDSSDPAHSTNGMYNAATRKAGGDVATTDGIINVGNAKVYGKVKTAPWLGPSDYTILANGRVGDLEANWPATSGIETGWYGNDYNGSFADVVAPYSSGIAPPSGSGTNTYSLGNSTYYVSGDMSLKNNDVLRVTGVATLYVTGTFDAKNGSYIVIDPGARLLIYVGAATGPAVAANFSAVNLTGSANNFQFFGLPTCTTATWSGNDAFVGCVYAPEADFTLAGGGNTIYDYQGACVVKSVGMNGHFNFHYDENLKRVSIPVSWVVASWQELAPAP